MEQTAIFENYNFNVLWSHPSNRDVIDKRVPTLGCPSTPQAGLLDQVGGIVTATTDYVPHGQISNTMLLTEDAGRPQFFIKRTLGPQNHNNSCGNLDVSNGRVQGGWADPNNNIPIHGFSGDGLSCTGQWVINKTNNNEAYSFHIGGLQINLADGSTHFITESIDIEVYASILPWPISKSSRRSKSRSISSVAFFTI